MTRATTPVILAASLILAACATRPATSTTAAETHVHETAGPADHAGHDMGTMSPAEETSHAAGFPGVTAADVKFMQDMIGHHEQALVMSAMAPTRASADHVLKLAQKIDISQRDEIGMMKTWLTDRRQALPDPAHSGHAMMPGMLTPDQLRQLEAARGNEFDRLFLRFMIQHHVGALSMVEELFASPNAAQDSDIFRFATDVSADQQDEIDVMEYMLTLIPAN